MDYLTLGFSWQFSTSNTDQHSPLNQLRQLPMQAFSDKNYQGKYNCFDDKWLKLKNPLIELEQGNEQYTSSSALFIEQELPDTLIELNVDQLIAFYQHPAKMFAQQQLNLYLDQKIMTLDDAEPFAIDHLESYLLRQALLKECMTQYSSAEKTKQQLNNVLNCALRSGKFPHLPTTLKVFENWQNDSIEFSQAIIEQNANNPALIDVQITIDITDLENKVNTIKLIAKLPIKAEQLIFYRSSTAKAKDLFTLYIHQLIVQVYQDQYIAGMPDKLTEDSELISQVNCTHGFYFDTKSQKTSEYIVSQVIDAKAQLTKLVASYFLGQQQALLLNGDIADKAFKANIGAGSNKPVKIFEQNDFEKLWQDPNAMFSLGDDGYMHYFWPKCPIFSEYQQQLADIYLPMYLSLEKVKSKQPTKKIKAVR